MNRLIGRLLMATGIGHTLVGVVVFRDALAGVFHDGFLNAFWPHFDRLSAFWFLLFSPALFMLGQITNRAVERQDARTFRIVGGYLLGMGIVGVAALPISGFWIVIALASLILRIARRVEAPPEVLAGAVHLEVCDGSL